MNPAAWKYETAADGIGTLWLDVPERSANTLSSAVLIITSIHHAYGAYVYDTPWRYHAVFVAGVTAPLIFGALAVMRSRPSGLLRTLADPRAQARLAELASSDPDPRVRAAAAGH